MVITLGLQWTYDRDFWHNTVRWKIKQGEKSVTPVTIEVHSMPVTFTIINFNHIHVELKHIQTQVHLFTQTVAARKIKICEKWECK